MAETSKPEVNADLALMIDIETLSLRPDAAVVQVGLCLANVKTYLFWIDPVRYHVVGHDWGHTDPQTIKWWMGQPESVRKLVFSMDTAIYNPITPDSLFAVVHDIVRRHSPTVWASPAMFDLPILTSMWRGQKPWHYSAERDLGTLRRLVDPDGAHAKDIFLRGEEHDAAYDAHWQMLYLFKLLSKLRGLGVEC